MKVQINQTSRLELKMSFEICDMGSNLNGNALHFSSHEGLTLFFFLATKHSQVTFNGSFDHMSIDASRYAKRKNQFQAKLKFLLL